MEVKPVLVFDMDGVLVDVTESYREAIHRHRSSLHRQRDLTGARPGL